mgnify:CR=1 FL=1
MFCISWFGSCLGHESIWEKYITKRVYTVFPGWSGSLVHGCIARCLHCVAGLYTLSRLHECRVVPGKDKLGNVIFGVTDPVWIVYADIISFYETVILYYFIGSRLAAVMDCIVPRVYMIIYCSPVGGSLIPILQSGVLHLGWYILPLWLVFGMARLITSADVSLFPGMGTPVLGKARSIRDGWTGI